MPDPREILHRWVDGVNRGEVQYAAGLYAGGSILLATFPPDVLCAPSPQIEGYFQGLMERGDLRVILDGDSVVVQARGGNCYMLIGRYAFEVDTGGATLTYPSRFTFVVDVSKASPILHHHSSRMPTGGP